MIIAIDGPTASGKSTLAQMIAQKLGIYYVSTGMMYRALAYVLTKYCSYHPDQLKDPSIQDIHLCLEPAHIEYVYSNEDGVQLIYKGNNITQYLKTKEMDYLASLVATNEHVREALVRYQRELAKSTDIVMEGRDIGSVVFPNADYKFYITATLEERAKRWQKDQAAKGTTYTYQESIENVVNRDRRDIEREHSPLVVAPGAIVIDDTNMTKEETLQTILKHIAPK